MKNAKELTVPGVVHVPMKPNCITWLDPDGEPMTYAYVYHSTAPENGLLVHRDIDGDALLLGLVEGAFTSMGAVGGVLGAYRVMVEREAIRRREVTE